MGVKHASINSQPTVSLTNMAALRNKSQIQKPRYKNDDWYASQMHVVRLLPSGPGRVPTLSRAFQSPQPSSITILPAPVTHTGTQACWKRSLLH